MKWKKMTSVFLVICTYFLCRTNAEANSLEVNQGDLAQVLLTVAANENLNLVLDPRVQGELTVTLQNMKAREMLEIIAGGNDLNYDDRGDIIYITPNTSAKKLRTVSLDYLDLELAAREVSLALKGNAAAKGKDDKGDEAKYDEVVVNPYNNTVSFMATARQYQNILHSLKQIDRAPRQVSLEAKILAVEEAASRDLGLDWSWSEIPAGETLTENYQGDDAVKEHGKKDKAKQDRNLFGTAIRFGKNITGVPYEIGLTAKLNALVSSGRAKILAKPNITTLQGREAVINIGGEVPVQTTVISDNTTTTSVTYRQAGIILRCKPRINEEGLITVEVHTEVSHPSYIEDLKAFRFQKRSADTKVRLRQGETMVIGGLINRDEINNLSRVPLLSKIPLLGNLFKHSQKSRRNTEVMLFLTAREIR